MQTPQLILASGHLTTSCALLRLAVIFVAYSQQLHCLAFRFLTSCISNVLAGKLQKKSISTSCGDLRVLVAEELLASLNSYMHYFWAVL